ncbi:MAG: alpha/beta hydrolase [Propionicimonas sp.]|uniref:alpha/beta fold hydrolase n=1 Tax=Propionicimonas sp. TaxID=1955623 RepID=UPI003D0F0990
MIRSGDGTDVVVVAEGSGPAILVVHGGMSDESPWAKVAAELAPCHRVVRIRRRLYRPELPADPATDYAREVDDLAAVVATLDRPVVLVGHSSGAVVALEALLALPEAFAGAVLYEPPIPDLPLGRPDSLSRARAAQAAGHLGRAIRLFLREVVRVGAPLAALVGLAAGRSPELRTFGARQLDDWDALVRLGPRLDAWAAIGTPTLLLTGDRSPAHLGERVRLVAAALPRARVEVLHGQGHSANAQAPAAVARLIEAFAASIRAD